MRGFGFGGLFSFSHRRPPTAKPGKRRQETLSPCNDVECTSVLSPLIFLVLLGFAPACQSYLKRGKNQLYNNGLLTRGEEKKAEKGENAAEGNKRRRCNFWRGQKTVPFRHTRPDYFGVMWTKKAVANRSFPVSAADRGQKCKGA